jgi:RES domain-containing protein
VSLAAAWRAALDESIRDTKPFKGQCFRSVEIAYGLPDEVTSGEGTRLHGGRFVSLGSRAVFASLDEVTATREVTARKARLGGRAQIPLKDYPRFTYLISVEIEKCVDFRSVEPSSDMGPALAAALDPSDLHISQEVGRYLISKGVQGALVPSVAAPVAPRVANIIVFLDADPAPKIEIANREDIPSAIADLARRMKK